MIEEKELKEPAKKADKKDDKEIIKRALKAFKACEEADSDNRERALEDLRFARLGQQWPDKVKEDRAKAGRPCLTINTMPSYIRQVVNDARQNKPCIKYHPVDDKADVQTAKILDGIIRHIEANSRADIAYDTAIDHACSMNAGYIRVDVDYTRNDSFDLDIKIERIANPLTVYGDPYNPCPDGSKWNLAFVSETISEEEFTKRYPKADKVNFKEDGTGDEEKLWFDDEAIRVAEFWERKEVDVKLLLLSNGEVLTEERYLENKEIFDSVGLQVEKERPSKSYKVCQYVLNVKEVLETNEWAGMYIPIIPVYGEEVNENGKIHYMSLIHHAKDAQRNKNYWRTCATEQVALASKTPWVGPTGFTKKDPNWDTANTINHPYLEYEGMTPPTRQPFPGIPAGALQEAMNASDDIKAILGLFDASLGAKSNETSGIAINARKKEGDVSTFHFIDNLTRSIRQVGAVCLDLIPNVYSERQIIRILGEDGTPADVPMKQPVMITNQGYVQKEQAQKQQLEGVEHIFDLGVGKYDLTVSAGPSFNSRREEAAVQMDGFIKSFPGAAPIIGDLYAKNLDWPGAEEIAERLKMINPVLNKQQQGPDPETIKAQAQAQAAQQQAQIAQAKGQVDLQMKQADLKMKEMDLVMKDKEIEIQRQKGEVELIKARMSLASQAGQNNNQPNQNA